MVVRTSYDRVAARIARQLGYIRIETLYLGIALAFGTTLALVVPPFQNFDEVAHYQRAWSIMRGDLVARPDATVTLPMNVADLPERFDYVDVAEAKQHYAAATVGAALSEPISSDQVDVVCFAAGYNALSYIPQALGVGLVRFAGGSPLAALYAGRLLNLMACVGLTFVALRLLPYGKPLLFLVALFPMVVLQMASLSADGITLAGSFLFGALVLQSSQMEKLSRGRMLAIATSAVVLLNFKPGYAPLSLLLLLLRPRQIGSWAGHLAFVALTSAASLLGALAIVRLSPDPRIVLLSLLGPFNGVDPSAQLGFILAQPIAFLNVMLATFASEGLQHAKHMVGALAWSNLEISDTVAFACAIGLVLCLLRDEPVKTSRIARLILLASSLATASTVALAAYVTWTPVGADTIHLVQGRYFLPALPSLLYALDGIHPGRSALAAILLATVCLAIVSTLDSLIAYYY